jgi:polyhydroxybutyrate depolymerase
MSAIFLAIEAGCRVDSAVPNSRIGTPDAAIAADANDVSDAQQAQDRVTPKPDVQPPEPPWVAPALASVSAGCGGGLGTATGPAGRMMTTPGGRTYRIVVPSSYDPNKPYPTVLAYHGWFTDGTGFKGWFAFERWVGDDGILLYPDANNGNGTFDLSSDRELSAFDEMMTQVQSDYCVNPQRTFALGFSFGGKFVNHLACHRAGYVRAASIGDASEGDNGADRGCGRLPLLITHRTADTDEIFANGKANAETWATRNGCSLSTQPALTPGYSCDGYFACTAPGATYFCTDTEDYSSIPGYDPSWNHTISERYRAFTWKWFTSFQ